MSLFHFVLGASALSAASGVAQTANANTAQAQIALLDSISRAVTAGVIPPPPKAPGPPPPSAPWFCNAIAAHQSQMAASQHDIAMRQFEREMQHWQNIVEMTFGSKRR